MNIVVILIIVFLLCLILFEYSACVVSKRADEQAEKMEREHKEKKDGERVL